MSTYDTIENVVPVTLGAWDGRSVGYNGCNPGTTDWSKAAYQYSNASSPMSRSYEPYAEIRTKSYFPGENWENASRVRELHGNGVVMTNYHISKTIYQNFLVRIPYLMGAHRYCSRRKNYKPTPTSGCTFGCDAREHQIGWGSYDWVGDYVRMFEDEGNNLYYFSGIDENLISQAVLDVRAAAASKSFRDYDALTDLCQIKQGVSEFRSIAKAGDKLFRKFVNKFPLTDLRIGARITPKRLLRMSSRALRNIGSAWLAYRYMIMPLVYSLNDIQKVFYRTATTCDRSRRVINPTSLDPGSLPEHYIRVDVSGDVSVAATVTCKYTSESISRMAGVSINPLSTAWEFIPYSFVFDWFYDVGDYITRRFSLNFASSEGACCAIRRNLTTSYTFVWNRTYSVTASNIDPTGTQPLCWSLPYPDSNPTLNLNGTVEQVLRTVTLQSYDRTLFNRQGNLVPQLEPTLNWKRLADSVALSSNLFRAFKKLFQ